MPRETVYSRNKKDRHSYVRFFMSNWTSGTAGLPRGAWSVLFQISLYNWDRAKPLPMSTLRLMLSDMPPEDAETIVNMLLDMEKVFLTDDGQAIYSEKAIEEGERAFAIWKLKSDGGKKARAAAKPKESSPTDGKSVSKSDGNSVTKTVPIEQRTENKEEKKEESNDSSKEKLEEESPPQDGDIEAAAALTAALAKRQRIEDEKQQRAAVMRESQQRVVMAWNAMAVKCGLAQISKMSGERPARLGARIEEHGADAIIEAINTIPGIPFLLGKGPKKWRANIDWLVQPVSCSKLIEGAYNEGAGESGPWR